MPFGKNDGLVLLRDKSRLGSESLSAIMTYSLDDRVVYNRGFDSVEMQEAW